MPRIDPEGQLTRAERLVVVIALAAAFVVHVAFLFGWGRLSRWAVEVEKKERLVVIRRVRDLTPQPQPSPEPPRPRSSVARTDAPAGGERTSSPPPDAPVKEPGEPPKEPELSPEMEQELREEEPGEPPPPAGEGENTVSVVTDLKQASFTLSGPAEFRGSGTLWLRKGAPAGTYTVTFHPVAGYATPAIQSKALVARGQVVFVGKYRRSVEVVVESNEADAEVTVHRPDGGALPIVRLGRVLLDDLPPGVYTAVFKELPGRVTPPSVTRTLAPGGGTLTFFGEYRPTAGGAGAGGRAGAPPPAGPRPEAALAQRSRAAPKTPRGPEEPGLDRRVEIVVTSYPPTDIEEGFDPIDYPEVVIRRSNFQRGWCQVYLIVSVDDRGQVTGVEVQRPGPAEREQYASLLAAVERAVRGWDYDKVSAEVHVDARFYVE